MSGAEARKQALLEIWQAAIDAVAGRAAVINALDNDEAFEPDLIVAVGKAAAGMCAGALERYPDCEALVVTKYDHSDAALRARPQVKVIESAQWPMAWARFLTG